MANPPPPLLLPQPPRRASCGSLLQELQVRMLVLSLRARLRLFDLGVISRVDGSRVSRTCARGGSWRIRDSRFVGNGRSSEFERVDLGDRASNFALSWFPLLMIPYGRGGIGRGFCVSFVLLGVVRGFGGAAVALHGVEFCPDCWILGQGCRTPEFSVFWFFWYNFRAWFVICRSDHGESLSHRCLFCVHPCYRIHWGMPSRSLSVPFCFCIGCLSLSLHLVHLCIWC